MDKDEGETCKCQNVDCEDESKNNIQNVTLKTLVNLSYIFNCFIVSLDHKAIKYITVYMSHLKNVTNSTIFMTGFR